MIHLDIKYNLAVNSFLMWAFTMDDMGESNY